MIAVGMTVLFASYTLTVWGYCLVRGYNVPFTGLFHSVWPAPAKG